MKPDSYGLLKSRDPTSDGEYVYKADQYFNTPEDERPYSMKIEYDGQSSTITYFTEKPGVMVVASDSPNPRERRKRVVFGLVCMKLLLSGKRCVQDL